MFGTKGRREALRLVLEHENCMFTIVGFNDVTCNVEHLTVDNITAVRYVKNFPGEVLQITV